MVIGTSAGGIEALQTLVGGLPRDLPAAVFIVLHMQPWLRSELPKILARHSRLGISEAEDQQLIESGHIYLAPPDYHLLIESTKRLSLWHGPKENSFRPAINPLFRSAAEVYKERVIGVILTGMLEDGVAGLAWVKRHGGIAVVQHPEEAPFPDMPLNALQHVDVDYIKRLAQIPHLLSELADGARRSEL